MPLPPRIVRRLMFGPLVLAISLVLIALAPALLLAAAVTDLVLSRRRWQTTRVVAFAEAYLCVEVAGLLALFGLWIASGFGATIRSERMQRAHYGLLRRLLAATNGAVRRLFRMKIWIEDRPERRPGPILVFSRHAGPGNSLMLVGTLMIGYRRSPRIVMLAKLQWEPLFDTMLNRLPNRFIQHDPRNRQRYVDMIGELASGLGDDDAFVLFPEGHDFTYVKRLRAIAHLRKRGYHDAALKAERMERVLPPKHGGVMAAITAAPDADVVFVAHTVLEDIGTFRDLWRRVPFEAPILSRYWRIPPGEVPREREELIEWLFEWWRRIDGWIDERRTAPQPSPATAGEAVP
ncbi:MAG TPA: 1-acyl-sn-glycerol-3-phosphate acyltransferase [Actinomycetota bacterium]